ncbi:MFS general substrate transporter [Marasmius fiardii PR-910]|nr:MFS general substrate transporter [Marasmius fiardii PR-910]
MPDTHDDPEDQTATPKNEGESTYEVNLKEYEHPQNKSYLKKWLIVIVISASSLCVTCASSAAAFAEDGMARELHVSKIVTILSISLFVEGLGFGPLLVGPLSEVYGRNIIYRVSFVLLFAFSWAVAFAPNIEVLLIFRFITGFCGSAFLSVAGGSVSDLFVNEEVATPMAFYTLSPFIGPVVGPLFSGQHIDWRWTFHVMTIWIFVQTVTLFLVVPETYVPVLRKWKAARLRKEHKDEKYWAPLDYEHDNIWRSILVSCYKPFQLIFYDQMVLLLNLWSSVVLGILYLAFQAFPVIFGDVHGFNMQSIGLSFLGIGIGMAGAMTTQVLWNRILAKQIIKHGGTLPPESHLLKGEAGAVLVPVGLFWMAFTTYPHVHWIVPIIASVPFGAGSYFVFSSVFTYLVSAYRPIAASAMASNSAMRSTVAAVFPLFAGAMYDKLGTVGATAVLGGIMAGLAPLPFIFRKIGARLREKSRFAVT